VWANHSRFSTSICRNNITICSGLGEFSLTLTKTRSLVTSEECRSSVATCDLRFKSFSFFS